MDEDDDQLPPTRLQDFPADLLAKIFACLPVLSILQLRCVCKLWNSIISCTSTSTSPSLWSKHSHRFPPWIIMYSSRDSIAAFNPSSALWLTIPLPSLPGFSPCKRILASSSGLICFCISCDSCRLLFVCNPITRDCKTLPELPLQGEEFLTAMVVDDTGSSYKIYVAEAIDENAHLDGGPQATFYSSLDDTWHPMDARDLPLIQGCRGHHNILHTGTIFSVSKARPPHQLITYNTLKQETTHLELPFERSMSLFPPLSVSRGRVFLAGGEWEYFPFSSFNLWELDPYTKRFIQMDSTPCAALNDSYISPLPVKTLQRLGNGDFLFFHARVLLCPLIHDLVEKSWICMTRYYGPCKALEPSIMYEPSFSARV